MAANEKKTKDKDKFVGCIGHRGKQSVVIDWLKRLSDDNFQHEKNNQSRWSGNIWGLPGCVLPETLITIRKKSNEGKHNIIVTK